MGGKGCSIALPGYLTMKPLYSSLVETIKSLPIKPEYSTPAIQMRLDSDNEIMVIGAPDPQEWLIGREVEYSLILIC